MTKRCSKCGEVKDIGEFHEHKECKDGHVGYCKKCNYEGIKLRRKKNPCWRQKYRERELEYNKIYVMNHPDKKYNWDKTYREKNKIKIKSNKKKWKENNREHVIHLNKLSRHRHPEAYRRAAKKYRLSHRELWNKTRNVWIKNNLIRIDGIKYYKSSVPEELKPIIETLIMIRNKKNLYRRLQDV